MRTSLTEIKKTEEFVFNRLSRAEKQDFEFQLSLDPIFRWNLALQKKLYRVLQAYHRKKVKQELVSLHERLFPGNQ